MSANLSEADILTFIKKHIQIPSWGRDLPMNFSALSNDPVKQSRTDITLRTSELAHQSIGRSDWII
jgi:hypothetical protein